jgi:hypothetical protein
MFEKLDWVGRFSRLALIFVPRAASGVSPRGRPAVGADAARVRAGPGRLSG